MNLDASARDVRGGEGEGGGARDTHGGLRLRAPPTIASAAAGGGTRASRCRVLRALPGACGGRHREKVLLALVRALADSDPEIRIAALDGLHALACSTPRLRTRIAGVLVQVAVAPSRSVAMHAAVLCAALVEPTSAVPSTPTSRESTGDETGPRA